MARTTTVIQRTNRFTGEKDVVEIENKAASAGGDVNGTEPNDDILTPIGVIFAVCDSA